MSVQVSIHITPTTSTRAHLSPDGRDARIVTNFPANHSASRVTIHGDPVCLLAWMFETYQALCREVGRPVQVPPMMPSEARREVA